MNKPVYSYQALQYEKSVKQCMKPKYGKKAKLCYMDTSSFVIQRKQKIFDTSTYELDRPLHRGKNEKVIGLTKDELGRKMMLEFVALRPKAYS